MWHSLARFSIPHHFYIKSKQPLTVLAWVAFFFLSSGTFMGLYGSPPDYQQGDAVRIMYVHVPAAVLSMACLACMGGLAGILLIWRIKMAGILLRSAAWMGALLTCLALVTGSIWGRPMWGTWWVWDARLTSEFILCMMYVAMLALQQSFRQREVADRAMAILTLIGLIDLPIIHYSVYWWNTLHQGTSFPLGQKPLIESAMLWPLGLMFIGMMCFGVWGTFQFARIEIGRRGGRRSMGSESIDLRPRPTLPYARS